MTANRNDKASAEEHRGPCSCPLPTVRLSSHALSSLQDVTVATPRGCGSQRGHQTRPWEVTGKEHKGKQNNVIFSENTFQVSSDLQLRYFQVVLWFKSLPFIFHHLWEICVLCFLTPSSLFQRCGSSSTELTACFCHPLHLSWWR